MKPVTYDFDVITDAPRISEQPQRRPPQQAEKAPQPDAEEERSPGQRFAPPEDGRRTAPSKDDPRAKVQAAE